VLVTIADGARLHVGVTGPQTGPPVLFIHGFPLTGAMWSHAAAEVSARWRCIVPDLRGLGGSPALVDAENVTIATYARDLVGVLDALGETRPLVMVGLSMGGMIAMQLVRRHRARVRGLVLCNTRAGAESLEGARLREQRAALALDQGAQGVRATADAMIGPVLAPEVDSGVRERVHAMMCSCDPVGVAAASRALASRPDSWPTLAALDVPTRFIGGERDQVTSPESMREMVERTAPAAGATLTLIPGAGHIPPMETPAAFAAALRTALESVERALCASTG
jgi:pimeloyl-ACP methyl ester carboxylesterase